MRCTPFLRIAIVLLLCLALCCTLTDARRRRGRRGRQASSSRRNRHRSRRPHPRPQLNFDNDSLDADEDADEEAEEGDWDEGGLSSALNFTPPPSPRPTPPPSPTDAHMMLVLQWPESLCAANKRGCQAPVHPHLTIHGLWPVQRRLVHCRPDFDELKMEAIAVHLKTVWPSYFHRTNLNFWQHEYDKHGSCLYATMEEYFSAALELQRRHPLLDIIKPSVRPQPLSAYRNVIKARLGVEPMFMCNTNWLPRRSSDAHLNAIPAGTRRNEQLLVEVGICFSEDGVPRDCPAAGRIRRCPKMRDVLFPPLHTFTQPPEQSQLNEFDGA